MIPRYGQAVFDALRFDRVDHGLLRSLSADEWRLALQFCDPLQLTFTLNHAARPALPAAVRERIDGNLRTYGRRFERLRAALLEIAETLDSRAIDFTVLKGFTHAPEFSPDPLLRVPGDIDLWCRPPAAAAARDALLGLGYRNHGADQGRHLAPMVRDTGWEWRGDYFASDLPVAVEIHYRLWDSDMERIEAPGEEQFRDRRVRVPLGGRTLPQLAPADTLAFAALHLLMHLLHGDLRVQRAWELAGFLHRRAGDEEFWRLWRDAHPDALRRLEAIVFRLAAEWFGCALAPALEEEIAALPAGVSRWLERHAMSPVEGLFQPNKHELRLQLALVESRMGRLAVLRRRIFPVEGRPGRGRLASRAVHHARTLVPALLGALGRRK